MHQVKQGWDLIGPAADLGVGLFLFEELFELIYGHSKACPDGDEKDGGPRSGKSGTPKVGNSK